MQSPKPEKRRPCTSTNNKNTQMKIEDTITYIEINHKGITKVIGKCKAKDLRTKNYG